MKRKTYLLMRVPKPKAVSWRTTDLKDDSALPPGAVEQRAVALQDNNSAGVYVHSQTRLELIIVAQKDD